MSFSFGILQEGFYKLYQFGLGESIPEKKSSLAKCGFCCHCLSFDGWYAKECLPNVSTIYTHCQIVLDRESDYLLLGNGHFLKRSYWLSLCALAMDKKMRCTWHNVC